jgi:2-keto-3-deoxy-L-rhamnonate aldolase RhmA
MSSQTRAALTKGGEMRLLGTLALATLLVLPAATALQAQIGSDFDPSAWSYGPANSPDGPVEIWNPVKLKLMNGEPVIGGTIRAPDPRTYCEMAAAGYDFTWAEMQHEAMSWEQLSRMWLTCPGPGVPGVRIAHESEGNVQMPVDMGALVIVVPTVDTVEEAQRAVDWTHFPPMGRRSNGGGQAFGATMWGQVPGGYRETWNENVVLILMIETLEGVQNAREIAALPGVDALFAASGDLGNFSGYEEGDAEYEMLVTEIVEAARSAGKAVCGPLRWMGTRPEFTCFQGGTEGANIRRGAQAEIQAAQARMAEAGADAVGGPATVLADLAAACGQIVYLADCLQAVRAAASSAASLPEAQAAEVTAALLRIASDNPAQADAIREAAAEGGLAIGG